MAVGSKQEGKGDRSGGEASNVIEKHGLDVGGDSFCKVPANYRLLETVCSIPGCRPQPPLNFHMEVLGGSEDGRGGYRRTLCQPLKFLRVLGTTAATLLQSAASNSL